ncbi:peptidoglycan-binding domain-containing protein [Pasteurella atlantica]|uniref:Peptidoglycan-binding domain-containing protein n=2 Tax=Pasteurellaceae TaxID=712 RepID=A0ACC6HK32_9PAST|nr:peptidoglycan-binding domain-containing protein [Pasteurella atlantica]MDP8033721.1 peptidoglycan-binding domain-containing protein [Pasteurella atlantica]MDP8035656.1 peptidoglycan-binding domain-containing protein [Pasteurella atlantica]MDP8037663.1 peptidoglycan-binding domain-containing protein [Pasteurella atlantica]MDP8047956.1 peptidoglycan-binding domain-containing protein [Pasteurella atlantica]MDP8049911.1 peptidoglycan-binding domain-containing protein [Pasteurella atlantica]
MKKILLISITAGVVLTGCSTSNKVADTVKNVQLPTQSMNTNLYPPNAKPGECYARVLTPVKYDIKTEKVLAKAASETIAIIPATYKTVEERVLVTEKSTKLQVIPATYKTVEEKILVSPEKEVLVKVPATYKTVEEKILVRPAYTTWKRGVNPITGLGTPYTKITKNGKIVSKHDQTTGEIMCLVEVPAKYKVVSKRVVATPATVERKVIPAKYKMVSKRVVVTPATTKEIVIPAKYKTITVKKLQTAAKTVKTKVPAEYKTVEKRVVSAQPVLEWREILCETNTTPDLIRQLQTELNRQGYRSGPVDGVLGHETLSAVVKYQKAHNLATGQLTLATLKSLGL